MSKRTFMTMKTNGQPDINEVTKKNRQVHFTDMLLKYTTSRQAIVSQAITFRLVLLLASYVSSIYFDRVEKDLLKYIEHIDKDSNNCM